MGLYDSSGNRITKAGFPSTPATTDPQFVVTQDVYSTRRFDQGTVPANTRDHAPEGSIKTLLYRSGDVVKQSDIDRLFPAASVAAVSPITGPAAGGTVVTITGAELDGVTDVKFGGTSGTNLKVLTSGRLQVTVPAHATGAVNVVVSDDSGAVTKTNGFTYV
ncbi:IPT/TIG domain-containing protein [Streptomyces sp. MC1]|uniref:IPT/TIG domain-containing protein n=1 Tax=Streptomyces sp. MC1 TaxID=295105 RepID=UPI0018CA5549|nr:IPT/TIG domain-containing protein [Streptomyces sp. MC1]MBG7704925.1 IPT/TIG domain-containing protein [Streptomyces sp. MC1]